MSLFALYFQVGVQHIADLKGYDHILFILTLCAVYPLKEWKRVLILVTAFTIGHSLTLALATLKIVRVNTGLIEFLIPLTIFITALANIVFRQQRVPRSLHLAKYSSALFFGLIHGLGFSNYLRGLLGSESGLVVPLFSFNLGIEAGQISILVVVMAFSWVVVSLLRMPRREWHVALSGAGMGISLVLMAQRFPF